MGRIGPRPTKHQHHRRRTPETGRPVGLELETDGQDGGNSGSYPAANPSERPRQPTEAGRRNGPTNRPAPKDRRLRYTQEEDGSLQGRPIVVERGRKCNNKRQEGPTNVLDILIPSHMEPTASN